MLRTRFSIWVALVAILMLAVPGAGAAAALRYDASRAREILPGISVGGIPVGGLQADEAQEIVRQVWEEPLDTPMRIEAGTAEKWITPRELGVTTNAARRLDEAVRASEEIILPLRLWHRISGRPVERSYPVRRIVDSAAVDRFIATLASEVEAAAVDSKIDTSSGFIEITDERDGFSIPAGPAKKVLVEAIENGAPAVQVPGEVVEPKLRRSGFAKVILVRIGENKLYYYEGGQISKVYDVATGLPQFPTPVGSFRVVSKRRNPVWVNPAKFPGGWGWKLPERIEAGSQNPLGTRALDINSRGIRIHGSSNRSSIGFNASHGCIRMRMADIEELFETVPTQTPVIMLRAGPPRLQPNPQPEIGPPAEADATVVPGVAPASAPPVQPSPTPQAVPVPPIA